MGVLESPQLKTPPDDYDPEKDDIWNTEEWQGADKLLSERGPQLKHEYNPEKDAQLAWVLKDAADEDGFSLEHKLIVSSYGRNTLETSLRLVSDGDDGDDEETKKKKRKECAAVAQKMFKPGDKVPETSKYAELPIDKTNHVANYVTNKWALAALESLQSDPPLIKNLEKDMRVQLLISCCKFIMASWVIDNRKKLEILKDKQGMDWYGLTNSILDWVKKKKIKGADDLVEVAEETKKFLERVMNGASPKSAAANQTVSSLATAAEADSSDGPKKTAATTEAEKEAIRARRESMRAKMRGSATSLASLAAVPAPAPQASIPRAMDSASSRWGANRNPTPHPTYAPPVAPAMGGLSAHPPQMQNVPASGPPTYRAPSPVGYPPINRAPSPARYDDPRGAYGQSYDSLPPRPPSPVPQNRAYTTDNNVGQTLSLYNERNHYPVRSTATSSHDFTLAANERRSLRPPTDDMGVITDVQSSSWNNQVPHDNNYAPSPYSGDGMIREENYPPANYAGTNRPPLPPSDPPPQQQQQHRDKRKGDGRGGGKNGNNNKRFRADPSPPAGPPAGGGGRGRGLALTRPAWMTAQDQDQNGPTGMPPGEPPNGVRPTAHVPPAFPHDGGGGGGRGRGRGVDMTKPAWMTQQGGGGGGGGEVGAPPPPGRPPLPMDDCDLGRGRGRGRTLPAWMTNQP